MSQILDRPIEVGERLNEEMCISDSHSAFIMQQTGRPCPRVELHPENRVAASMVFAYVQEFTRPIANLMFEIGYRHSSENEKMAVLERVVAAITSPAMVAEMTTPLRKPAKE